MWKCIIGRLALDARQLERQPFDDGITEHFERRSVRHAKALRVGIALADARLVASAAFVVNARDLRAR